MAPNRAAVYGSEKGWMDVKKEKRKSESEWQWQWKWDTDSVIEETICGEARGLSLKQRLCDALTTSSGEGKRSGLSVMEPINRLFPCLDVPQKCTLRMIPLSQPPEERMMGDES